MLIKYMKDDIEELDMTFSIDEEIHIKEINQYKT